MGADSRLVLGWQRHPEQLDLSRLCRREVHEPVSLHGPRSLVPAGGVGCLTSGLLTDRCAAQLMGVRSCGRRGQLRFAGPCPEVDDLRDGVAEG